MLGSSLYSVFSGKSIYYSYIICTLDWLRLLKTKFTVPSLRETDSEITLLVVSVAPRFTDAPLALSSGRGRNQPPPRPCLPPSLGCCRRNWPFRSGSPTRGSPASITAALSSPSVAGPDPHRLRGGHRLPLSSWAVLETPLASPRPGFTHQGVCSVPLPATSPAPRLSQDIAPPS